MADADAMPHVPPEHLEGWTCTDRTSETVFRLPVAEIVGHTAVYGDEDLRETIRSLTGGTVDRTWRFFFATRLTFTPPLPPAVGPAAVFSTVEAEANAAFTDRLRDRGFTDVSEVDRERIRADTGDSAFLTTYDATVATDVMDIPVRGHVGVWTTAGEFRLAGGAYPAASLEDLLGMAVPGVDIDPEALREELVTLIRAVR
ncbi:MAG: hypothetical protein ABEJ30_05585 [Halorientalis sp.]